MRSCWGEAMRRHDPLLSASFFRRRADTHKGDYGHVLVIGGSVGMTGAPVMAAQAALRCGAGLVTLAVPEAIYFIAACKLTEGMVHPLPESSRGTFSTGSLSTLTALIAKASVLAVGPGLSQEPSAQRFAQALISKARLPIVLDADGINAFAGSARKKLARSAAPLVITPHPGEMARLLGTTVGVIQRDRAGVAKKVARELKAVVVLKGHRTVVASPRGEWYVNMTGNPGMATAGMGDLLTGMIAALIGQGMAPFPAARAGVYLHGLAGDLSAKWVGQISLTAGDVLAELPHAIQRAAHG